MANDLHERMTCCVDPMCRMVHARSCGRNDCHEDHRANTRDIVNFIGNAPISARLRNELVRVNYADHANHLAALVFGDDVDDIHTVTPNFFSYAQWGAYTVGRFLRAPWRWLPTGQAVGQELEDGNADIYYAMASRAARFFEKVDPEQPVSNRFEGDQPEMVGGDVTFSATALATEEHGIPAKVLDQIDVGPTATLSDVTGALREKGFELYEQAVRGNQNGSLTVAERQAEFSAGAQ